jgi:hypothetical protein
LKAKLERRLNALEEKDFKWPRLCYTVEKHDGESVEEACKRLDIPTEIIGPNGQRIETLIISLDTSAA